jgi:hypothetical protein
MNKNDCVKTVKIGKNSHFEPPLPHFGTVSASRLVTRRLMNRVRQDDEGTEGHAVLFALGEEQAVGIATVAHTPQRVNVPYEYGISADADRELALPLNRE